MADEPHPDVLEQIRRSEAAGNLSATQLSVAGLRAQGEAGVDEAGLLDDPRPVGDVRDYLVPGPDGDVRLRCYVPDNDGPLPVFVWYHGGGWVTGSLDSADPGCRYVAAETPCVVVSADYRLAPEHPFPAPFADCYVALDWTADNAESIGGDPGRLAVGGVSAGGNLAAAVSLAARDRDGPDVALQVLAAPVLNHAFDTASYEENAAGYDLTRAEMRTFWDRYLADDVDGRHPYASPLTARDLSDLPDAVVLTGEFDPLRDEGRAYARRLTRAGVGVTHLHYEDMTHPILGSFYLEADVEPTVRAFEDTVAALSDHFDRA